ncbi:unnamed protein product [Chrysoparadoxa australica]
MLGHDAAEWYAKLAEAAGEAVWKFGLLKKGPGLCHGVSGNAYALLFLYKVRPPKSRSKPELIDGTSSAHREPKVAGVRAEKFAAFMGLALNQPDHLHSLFEGLAGAACLDKDLSNSSQSHFPLWELE